MAPERRKALATRVSAARSWHRVGVPDPGAGWLTTPFLAWLHLNGANKIGVILTNYWIESWDPILQVVRITTYLRTHGVRPFKGNNPILRQKLIVVITIQKTNISFLPASDFPFPKDFFLEGEYEAKKSVFPTKNQMVFVLNWIVCRDEFGNHAALLQMIFQSLFWKFFKTALRKNGTIFSTTTLSPTYVSIGDLWWCFFCLFMDTPKN